MSDEERDPVEAWINIRKLAALGIVFHSSRLILAEFAFTVIFCGIFGTSNLLAFARDSSRPLFPLVLGVILSGIALNFLPLLLYAIIIIGADSAQREVAFELKHKDTYARKYSVQSSLLLVPLVIFALAIFQEFQKRSNVRKL